LKFVFCSMNPPKLILLFILVIFLQEGHAQSNERFLFIGHPNSGGDGPAKTDFRMPLIDYSEYKQLWLGGDLLPETAITYSRLEYLNDIFKLGSDSVHWTLGNHDKRNGNLNWIKKVTGRHHFYFQEFEHHAVLVLNGGLSPHNCLEINTQFSLIQSVANTMESGHLFVLIHEGVTSGIPGLPPPSNYGHTNHKNWLANCESTSSNFANSIYPELVKLQNKGVNVYWIMGDAGHNRRSFHQQTAEGIRFYISGLGNSYEDEINGTAEEQDTVLIFDLDPITDVVTWEFTPINDLY